MQKVILISKSEKIFVNVNYDYVTKKLSLSGVIKPKSNGDADCCGQIHDHLGDAFDGDLEQEEVRQLVEIWEEWHLNDLNAGCEHQRADKWHEKLISLDCDKWNGDSATRGNFNMKDGKAMAIWVNHAEHPDGLLSAPCPECNYRYGTKWLFRAVPDSVIKWLEKLPESSITPAWS